MLGSHRVLQQLQIDFKTEIGSLGATVIDTERLTSGAKIKNIFHKRLVRQQQLFEQNKFFPIFIWILVCRLKFLKFNEAKNNNGLNFDTL